MFLVALSMVSTRLPFPVNGALQITPLPLYFQVGFVNVPPAAHFPFPFAADVLSQQRSKTFLPLAYSFMSEFESAEQKNLCEVSQAEVLSQPAQHDLEDDVGRQFEVIEWSARALIRFSPTS